MCEGRRGSFRNEIEEMLAVVVGAEGMWKSGVSIPKECGKGGA